MGLNNSLCNWILDFITRRPQSVRVGHNTPSTTTLSTGAPQGCVLSPLLFTLLTHDCTAKFSSNHIIKFADDTSVVDLISNNDETHYREEVAQLAEWCGANNLSLNVGPVHPSLPQSLPAPTLRKTVPEHQSPLHQTAQQLFPPDCESPELNHPNPPNPTPPYLLKHGPSHIH